MTWDRYRSRSTGFIVSPETNGYFESLSYCDDPNAQVEITKPPGARLIMTPIVQFTNTNVTWDVSKSFSATGTIVTYDLDFGDTIIPPINNAPWTGAKTGTVQYTVPGTWLATLTTTDLLNLTSKRDAVLVTIIDPVPGYIVVGTVNAGVWVITSAGALDISNNLTGQFKLIRELWLHPQFKDLPPNQAHIIATTAGGVAWNTTGGASNWFTKTRAEMGEPITTGPETSANLDLVGVAFDPTNWKHVIVYRASTLASGGLWLYETFDYFQTWTNRKVTT